MIAMIPKLQSFNGVTITSLERVAAEKAFQPFLAIKSKNIKQFTSLSTKMSKQFTSDTGGNEISSPQSKKIQATVHNHIQLYNDLYKHQNQRLDLDDYTQEFNHVIKDIISDFIMGMRQHGQHY
jgi:hypothetical protein